MNTENMRLKLSHWEQGPPREGRGDWGYVPRAPNLMGPPNNERYLYQVRFDLGNPLLRAHLIILPLAPIKFGWTQIGSIVNPVHPVDIEQKYNRKPFQKSTIPKINQNNNRAECKSVV